MNNPLPKFGVSEFTTWPWTIEQDVARYKALGVDTIEVCEFKLDWQDASAMDAQLASIKDAGLTISSVQPRLHSLYPDQPRPEPVDPAARMALLKETIGRFATAGCAEGTTFVTITGEAPGANFREAYKTARHLYADVAQFASDHGARLAVEPLNPILMNADAFICTIPDALSVVDAVDSDSFGIFIDVWHIFEDPAVERHIAQCAGKIFGVHVNDWPAERPRCFGDRSVIGKGIIPLPGLLAATHATGYDGAYTLEIFSDFGLPDSLWNSDLDTVITESRAGFEDAWRRG